ncbi:hypothetical protein EYF80_049963 [Liparis tanakae]|uniref:Uncharacterized protein n=1 Tax=Liparis tanakae TaxID=230148 RepID=A0A4Z2FGI7_9TELE|nr:hypothetical protein EYF80_049963 [Liparis tanakae]
MEAKLKGRQCTDIITWPRTDWLSMEGSRPCRLLPDFTCQHPGSIETPRPRWGPRQHRAHREPIQTQREEESSEEVQDLTMA